jgi:hypothetical protein
MFRTWKLCRYAKIQKHTKIISNVNFANRAAPAINYVCEVAFPGDVSFLHCHEFIQSGLLDASSQAIYISLIDLKPMACNKNSKPYY